MGMLTNRVIEQVVLGMKAGGRIPIPVIESHIRYALRRLYERSSMVKGELPPISETINEKEYAMIAPLAGTYSRITDLSRVTRDDSSVITSVSSIQPEMYAVGLVQPADGSTAYEGIALADGSPATATDSLIPYGILVFNTDEYIPSIHTEEAVEAVMANVGEMISRETGKPWSNPNSIPLFLSNYDRALGIIRGRVIRGGTSRTLTMKATGSFV